MGTSKDSERTCCPKQLEEEERQKQIGMGALFSLRKRKASRTSAPETAETFVFHVHTERTWALAPGWIRGRGGVFRIIVASRLIFLTNGFHLFKERTILFKTELVIMGGEGS